MKRVKKIDPSPNPLFTTWLQQFKDEAKEKGKDNLVRVYKLCLESLGYYPLRLESGRQCKMLNGFGPKICSRLDQKLEEYNKQARNLQPNFPVSPLRPLNQNVAGNSGNILENAAQKNIEASKENKEVKENEEIGAKIIIDDVDGSVDIDEDVGEFHPEYTIHCMDTTNKNKKRRLSLEYYDSDDFDVNSGDKDKKVVV